MPKHDQTTAGLEALTRLIEIAQKTPANHVVSPIFYWLGITLPKMADGMSHRFVECGPEYRRRYVHGLASHSRGTAISRRSGFQG